MSYDAIVLCGGRSRRMRVEDKTRLVVGDRSMLDRVLAAVDGAERVIAVGDPRPTELDRVQWCREDPPGSGPAAGVAEGLVRVTAPTVVVLAGDLPFVRADDVGALVEAAGRVDVDGVVVEADGEDQWLLGAWRAAALRAAALLPGGSMRAAVADLRVARLRLDAAGHSVHDCDTPADLRLAEELAT